MRGERVAREAGCFACHGPGGSAGIADLAGPNTRVPSWEGRELASYARDVDELRAWIVDGVPRRLCDARGPDDARLLPMPAYGERLSKGEIDDLVAYLVAVSGLAPAMPDRAYEGRVVATRQGCFGCHGPSGMGGALNPGSFTGSIPALDGPDYAELVHDEGELRAWILDGHPRRLWDHPIARRFLEGQVVKMPAYRALLSEDDVGKLIAYIDWLRRDATPSPAAPAPAPPPERSVRHFFRRAAGRALRARRAGDLPGPEV